MSSSDLWDDHQISGNNNHNGNNTSSHQQSNGGGYSLDVGGLQDQVADISDASKEAVTRLGNLAGAAFGSAMDKLRQYWKQRRIEFDMYFFFKSSMCKIEARKIVFFNGVAFK